MKKSLFLIFSLLLVTGAYAKHMKKEYHPKITSISMHRTACFGRCPNYIIEISSDGTVTYSGIMFTKPLGVYQKNIGANKAKELFEKFEAYRVDTCQENYPMRIQDLPGIIYTIKYKDVTQKIMNANFGPPFLSQLAKDIDNMIQVDDSWKQISDKVNY